MDEYLKSILLNIFTDRATAEKDIKAFDRTLEQMWVRCRDSGAFGYSVHYQAVVWKLPDVFRLLHPQVETFPQFERMCRAMPALVKWLPYDSVDSPTGYTHYIDLTPLHQRITVSPTFEALISGFEYSPVRVCRTCGGDMQAEVSAASTTLTCACGEMVIG